MPALSGKVLVITGSTRGFGRALAEAALQAGATAVISGRDEQRVARVVEALRPLGPVSGRACDVTCLEDVEALAEHAIRTWGRFDIWVNNAGISTAAGRLIDVYPEDVMTTFRVNSLGVFHGTKVAMAHFLPRGDGILVNIYGMGSFLRPASPTGVYGASKAWVTSFTRTLAAEHKDSGVRIVGFSPGIMLTEMITRPTVLGERGKEMLRRYPFVLRVLGQPPQKPARVLVNLLATNTRPFVEYRMIKPWTFPLGMLRLLWENLTGRRTSPTIDVQVRPPHRLPSEQKSSKR